jgi:hypothetical protein
MGIKSDLLAQGFGGYGSWNDEAAIQADYKATGGSGKFTGQSGGSSSGSSGGGSSYQDFLNQQNQAQKDAIQPAIASLQATVAPTQAGYQQQVSQKQADIAPLTQRYQDLINTIKNQGQQQVNQQTVVTAGELGKRGIEGSSTLAGQTIQNAVQPIQQNTQGLTNQTGMSQQADIKAINDAIAQLQTQSNLVPTTVGNQIAQLQSGAGQTAIQQALQGYQFGQQQQTTQQQNAATNALAQAQLNATTSQNAIADAIARQNANTSSANSASQIALNAQQLKMNDPNYINTLLYGPNNGMQSTGGQNLPQAKSFKSS